jgi:hypothetical protein
MILKHGGPQAHEFIRVNLEGPVLNTTRSTFCKEAFTSYAFLREDVFKSLQKVLIGHKQRLGIIGPVPFEMAEDRFYPCCFFQSKNRRDRWLLWKKNSQP